MSNKEPSIKKVAESRAANAFRQVKQISQDQEYALVKLFEQEIDLARNIDAICKDISERNDSNFYEIYINFDPQKLNYITQEAYSFFNFS